MIIECKSEIVNGLPVTTMDVLFVLIDGADTFSWNITLPLMFETEISEYLRSRVEDFRCKIYSAQYPGAITGRVGEETPLGSWRRWETAGSINPDGEVIVKVPWADSFEYNIHTENYKAIKAAKVARLLKKGLIAEALKEKGGI